MFREVFRIKINNRTMKCWPHPFYTLRFSGCVDRCPSRRKYLHDNCVHFALCFKPNMISSVLDQFIYTAFNYFYQLSTHLICIKLHPVWLGPIEFCSVFTCRFDFFRVTVLNEPRVGRWVAVISFARANVCFWRFYALQLSSTARYGRSMPIVMITTDRPVNLNRNKR